MILFLPNKYVTDGVALFNISQVTLFLYITLLRHPSVDKQCTRVCYCRKLNSKIEIIRNVVPGRFFHSILMSRFMIMIKLKFSV